ncbi:single-stranded DNA-binding protein, partial [Neisseria meningitidis]
TLDKAGNGFAVIRFLPAPAGEDDPFVRMFSHGFKGPTNSWYIANSRTTLGLDDPVGELNSKLWNSGVDSDKEIARAQKRRLHFYSNIFVVK